MDAELAELQAQLKLFQKVKKKNFLYFSQICLVLGKVRLV
jgi:hypothetical protein